MEFLQTCVDFLSVGVIGLGGVTAVQGLINYGEGRSQDNPGANAHG